MGALASVMILWIVSGVLLTEAVQRFIHPAHIDGKSEY